MFLQLQNLGLLISPDGHSPDPKKVSTIVDFSVACTDKNRQP